MNPSDPSIQNILVIQLKHLGDVLLTTPLIDALGAAYPGARISILVNSGMEQMISGHPRSVLDAGENTWNDPTRSSSARGWADSVRPRRW
jgi:hypothetical protein